MNADDLLAALDPEQREVALASQGPVCVLAGAGTGKTRAVTHRIAYAVATGVVNPAHALALTFTVRAAGELRGRLRALGGGAEAVRAATFHSAALRQLSYFWPRVIGGRPPQLVESKLPLLREAARDLGLRADGGALSDAVTEIEWAKVCQTHPDSYVFAATAAGRTPALGIEDVGRLYQAYEALRRDRRLIDFESVLELMAAILLTEPAVASEVHAAYRYFTVDEFQDVNPLQKLLLDAWLGGREELCVVGDPQQTIYSFTGATSRYLRSFGADFPRATVIRLVRDYRSTPQLVAAANRLAGPESAALVAQRTPGPEPAVVRYPDEDAEAAGVAAEAAALIARGVPAHEIAILFRMNAYMERFEHALAEAKVPYVVRGAERFYDRPEVRQALVLIRGAARAAGAGTDATGVPGELAAAVRHVLASAGLTPEPPAARGAARERWESLAAIAALAGDLAAARPDATLAEFAAEIAERAESGHAPVAAAVTLATMHAAKGLEWDAVILPGLVEGIMPIVHAGTAEAIEEERRLLYVAVTRARVRLALSWAPARTAGAAASRQRSRFLASLLRAGDPPAPPGTGQRRPAISPARADAAKAAAPARHLRLGPEDGMNDSLDKLLDLLDLEQIEMNIFRGRSPDETVQRVFGGQVAGQALVAAGRTVPDDRAVHSLHAYFIRPGDPSVPLVYIVDRVRDGRSFSTRRVTAVQHGKAIFTLSASFHRPEAGVAHAMPMPQVPPPDHVRPNVERLAEAVGGKLPPHFRDSPIDLRSVGPMSIELARDPSLQAAGGNLVWLRVTGELPDDPLLHVCLMTYASDLTLLDSVLLEHGLSWNDGRTSGASLDHAMWFHRPFRADQWLLYAQESPVAFGGRGLARGEVFTAGGDLVVSVVQEGLIRTTPKPSA